MQNKRSFTPSLRIIIATTLIIGNLFLSPSLTLAEEGYSSEVSDPLENVNRGIFWVNDQFDTFIFKPVALAYDFIFPKIFKNGVSNAVQNIQYPVYLFSDLVQGKFDQAQTHTSRFLINSTIGIGGFFDLADEFGLEHHEEDFGTALAHYGVSDGPYIVLPFLGPSNLRDALAQIVDRVLVPTQYIVYASSLQTGQEDRLLLGASALEVVNRRAELLNVIDTAKAASVDYYLFVRSAHKQSRDAVIYDGLPPDDMDFEDEFEDEMDEE